MNRRLRGSILWAVILFAAAGMTACGQESIPPPTAEPVASTPIPTPVIPAPFIRRQVILEAHNPCGASLGSSSVDFHEGFLDWSEGDSHLVFDRAHTIWSVNVETAEAMEVVNANPTDRSFLYGYHADASPASSRIVYATCEYLIDYPADYAPILQSGGYEIATVDADGTGKRRLTYNTDFENYPAWSPDGTLIAFVTSPHGQETVPGHYEPLFAELTIMAADGSDLRRIDVTLDAKAMAVSLYPPVWSPDGQRLAFIVNERDGETGSPFKNVLYTIRSEGSNGSELHRIGETASLPSWSPDGERLVFTRDDEDGAGVYVVRYDGAEPLRVADFAVEVSWSPDGSEILLAGEVLSIVQPDGAGLRQLGATQPGIHADAAVWSSDGSMIAVRSGEMIFTMRRDGTDVRVLTGERSEE